MSAGSSIPIEDSSSSARPAVITENRTESPVSSGVSRRWAFGRISVAANAASFLVRPNGSGVKLQAAFTRERTGGAPLAARKERFCLSDLQAA